MPRTVTVRARTGDALPVVVLLGAAGLAVTVGGLAHPFVPADTAPGMAVIAEHALWLPAHWTLTFAQPVALVGVLLALGFARRDGAAGVVVLVGGGIAAAGFLIGSLGTLSAATALHAAARAETVALFEVVDAFTLGLGWTCLVLESAGTLIAGVAFARTHGRWRVAGGVLALGGGAFLLLAILFAPPHPWLHAYVLRAGAVFTGPALWALAWAVGERTGARGVG